MTRKLRKRRHNWEARFGELVAFKRRQGHCRVPLACRHNPYAGLGGWVARQRRHRHQLPPAKRQRLDSIGFIWNVGQAVWRHRLEELKLFRRRFGHSDVPQRWRKNLSLGLWVHYQRLHWRDLRPWQRQNLRQLEFRWKRFPLRRWEENLARLVAFRRRHGHCRVPSRHQGNPDYTLSCWTHAQRERRHILPPAKVQKLNALGFIWSLREAKWNARLKELRAFRRRHGHCNVPGRWPENWPLAYWVQEQRKRYQSKGLDPRCQRQLRALGFVWRIRQPRRNRT